MGCTAHTSLSEKDTLHNMEGLSNFLMDPGLQEPTRRLAHWRLQLMELNIEIVYHPEL